VTTLYALKVPKGGRQICRYDDGTGDEIDVPLGTTACMFTPSISLANAQYLNIRCPVVSGKTMFDLLPAELKSVAVRTKVRYAPHPYVWMAPAHAMPTGLGIESEGLELPPSEIPAWEESKIKVFPMVRRRLAAYTTHILKHYWPMRGSRLGRTRLRATCTSKFIHVAFKCCILHPSPKARNARVRSTLMEQTSRI
jgi:xanthine dioxygenase